MGLLDDAIREHLELKRRRGADLDEIARQEDEALGDPRSGEFAKPAEAEEPAAATDDEPSPEMPADEPDAQEDEPWLEDDDRIEPSGSRPTSEFTPPDVESEPDVVRPDDEPGAEEDVLGETPDFLQETPEHDRLWFEQKPPRDFDFDR
jgi:hypothetical protein